MVKKGRGPRPIEGGARQDLRTVNLPQWEFVRENEDGTWVIEVPDK